MSKRLVVDCDDHVGGCKAELNGYHPEDVESHKVMPEGWGKVYMHDEHYCFTCWNVYCHDNGVNKKTGRHLKT